MSDGSVEILTSPGNLIIEFRAMSAMPWGIATFFDIYVGFILFSCWIVSREESLPLSIIWIFLLMAGGNLIACIYALLAIHQSRGDKTQFWMGKRHAIQDLRKNS